MNGKIFFDPKTSEFLLDTYAEKIPRGAQEVSRYDHAMLMDGQGKGGSIVSGDDGRPVVVFVELTFEQRQSEILGARRRAYTTESDPLKNEAEHDAILSGGNPDYAGWLAKVAEIKKRYPLPTAD